MSGKSNSTEGTEVSTGSFESGSSVFIHANENNVRDNRYQHTVKETIDKSSIQITQEGRTRLKTFDDGDETCVKEYKSQPDAQNGGSNVYVEMNDVICDNHRVSSDKHFCRNTNHERSCRSSEMHTTVQPSISNSGHEYACVTQGGDQIFPVGPANRTRGFCSYPNNTVHFCRQGQQMSDHSGYIYIDQCKGSIPSQGHSVSINKYAFFRKGLCIFSALSFVLLLLNIVGLSFVYAAMKTQSDNVVPESNICMKCDLLNKLTSEEMQDLGVIKLPDSQCCVKSVGDLLAALIKGWPSYPDVEKNYELINTLLTRHRSAIHLSGFVANDSITWRESGVKVGSLNHDGHGLHVSSGGIYYVYVDIGFKKGPCHKRRRIGYRVKLKRENGKHSILATVKKHCINGTATEQDFTTQTTFQVPVGQQRDLFIDIDPEDFQFVLKHRFHKFIVFEI